MKAERVAKNFPVVCVGGSAGGLDAYTRLLRHLPADMGVGIVIVNHLRTDSTLLHQILPHYTKMPVELITERLLIQPNRVFIIPERRDLHVLDGEFHLKPISKPRGWPDVITVFLRSLTRHWGGQLIAVIVSGYDGDGAAALCGKLDGFVEGLFGMEEALDFPERAHRGLGALCEMRALFAATEDVATDETKPGTVRDMETTLRLLRQMTKDAEHEIHAILLSCARARRQMLASLPAQKPTLH
jgi:two-component system, chemotaxis family, protein-glutamate methylesterase/glutaminase